MTPLTDRIIILDFKELGLNSDSISIIPASNVLLIDVFPDWISDDAWTLRLNFRGEEKPRIYTKLEKAECLRIAAKISEIVWGEAGSGLILKLLADKFGI